MSVKFLGLTIPGTHGQPIIEKPALETKRQYFWGVRGVAEILGGTSFQVMRLELWIHDRFSFSQLHDFLADLDSRTGQHGMLEVRTGSTNQYLQRFDYCTFEGFERMPFAGQEGNGMIQDVAGTVESPAGYWLASGALHFTRLLP